MELALAALVFAALLLTLVALKWGRTALLFSKIPSPPGWDHLGALADPRRHHTLLRWSQEIGPVFKLRLLWMRPVVVTDPMLVGSLLGRGVDADKPKILSAVDKMVSRQGHPGLFSASTKSKYWRLVRKGTAPAFNPQNLRRGFPHIVGCCQEVCSVMRGLSPGAGPGAAMVDVDDLLLRQSLDVLGRVGFDCEFGAIQGYARQAQGDLFESVSKTLEEVTLRFTNPLRKFAWFLPSVREGRRHTAAFQAHMQRLLKEIKARGPPAEGDTSLAAHLLRLRDPDTGAPLSDDRLLPELATFFVAGFETSGHTNAWTLYLLARHPEAEARVCEELRGLGLLATPGGPPPRPLEHQDLSRLPFLNACIKESMRLLPVAADSFGRCFPQEVQLGPYTIPAGAWVWIYNYAVHRSPAVWDEPDSYLPERWLEPEAEYCRDTAAAKATAGEAGAQGCGSRLESQAEGGGGAPARALRFMPFAVGPRDCIGQSLAKITAVATVATLLGHLRFQLAPEMEGPGGVEDVLRLTLQPANGIKMICSPRA